MHSLMVAQSGLLRRLLLEEGACVFVAGSATSGLPEDTRKTLVAILGGGGEVRKELKSNFRERKVSHKFKHKTLSTLYRRGKRRV